MMTQEKSTQKSCLISTLYAEDSLAKAFQSLENEKDSAIPEGLSSLRSPGLPPLKNLSICSLKMFPDSYHITKAGRLRPSSVRWMIALALHGRYDVVWEVLNSADFSRAELRQYPNPEKECILSDFIEKSVPEKYCLSQTQIQKLLSKEFQAERETGYIQPTD